MKTSRCQQVNELNRKSTCEDLSLVTTHREKGSNSLVIKWEVISHPLKQQQRKTKVCHCNAKRVLSYSKIDLLTQLMEKCSFLKTIWHYHCKCCENAQGLWPNNLIFSKKMIHQKEKATSRRCSTLHDLKYPETENNLNL